MYCYNAANSGVPDDLFYKFQIDRHECMKTVVAQYYIHLRPSLGNANTLLVISFSILSYSAGSTQLSDVYKSEYRVIWSQHSNKIATYFHEDVFTHT